jgi:predicted ATPase with chaperone activity
MLAERVPGLLPDLVLHDALEVSAVHLSAYDLICRCVYDLTCRSVSASRTLSNPE